MLVGILSIPELTAHLLLKRISKKIPDVIKIPTFEELKVRLANNPRETIGELAMLTQEYRRMFYPYSDAFADQLWEETKYGRRLSAATLDQFREQRHLEVSRTEGNAAA